MFMYKIIIVMPESVSYSEIRLLLYFKSSLKKKEVNERPLG